MIVPVVLLLAMWTAASRGAERQPATLRAELDVRNRAFPRTAPVAAATGGVQAFGGTVRVYATADHANASNARFEALLECDAVSVAACADSALWHLPMSVVDRFDLRSGDRVRFRAAVAAPEQRNALPFAHALVYDVLDAASVEQFELVVRPSPPPVSDAAAVRTRSAGGQVAVDLRRVVLILLDLGGHPLECSRSHIENLFWDGNAEGNSVVDILESTTYGKRTLASDVDADGKHDVIGPYAIEFDGTCNFRSWKEQGDAAADQSGVELSIFQHRIYVLPFFHEMQGLCSWRGLGDFGCRAGGTCHVWTLSCGELQTYVHELGHNFDLAHAASFYNEQGTVIEYGDPTAVMGNRWFGKTWISNFNAPHKDASGWFDGTNKAQEVPLDADGVYALSPLDDFSDNTLASQLLKIRHQYTDVLYYFSYNAHSGDGLANRLLVHAYVNRTSPSLFLRALDTGDTFVDFQHRFAVSHLGVNDTMLLTHVQFGCTIAVPELELVIVDSVDRGARTFANGSRFDVPLGGALELEVRITNRNSPLCLSSHYVFEPQPLAGWASSVEPEHLMLASAQSCSVRWLLAASANATSAVDAALVLNVTHGDAGSYTDAPVLHTLGVDLRATAACQRAPPRFAVLDAWQQTHHRRATAYTFEIGNDDALLCNATTFAVDVDVDASVWNASLSAATLTVQASAVQRGTLLLMPLHDGVVVARNASAVRLTLRSLAAAPPAEHAAPVVERFEPLVCVAAPPVLSAQPDELLLEARSSTGARVLIENADANCVPTEWAFDYTDIPRVMHINLLPATVLLASGQHGSALVLFTAPTVGVVPFLRTEITVWDLHDPTRNASVSLALTSYDVPCEVRPPGVSVNCPLHVDVVAQRAFECKVVIDNHDSWPCIRRTFFASVINVPHAWLWTDSMLTWDAAKADTPVGTSFWLTLTVHVPRAFADRFNGSAGAQALPLDTTWAPIVNVTSDATPLGQLYTSDLVYFGTCRAAPPTATVSVRANETLVVPLNGSGDITVEVTNHDGVYCGDESHYDIKIDPPSLSTALRGGFGTVDVKRGRAGTGRWRFTGAEAGLYNASLLVTNRENATLAAAPLSVLVEVNASCTIRQPALKITSPFAPFAANAALPVRLPNTSYALYAPLRLPAGRALRVNYTVAVTNNDSPGCPDSAYRIEPDFSQLPNPNYYYYHSPPYSNAWHVLEAIVRVPANSTRTVAVSFSVDKSTAPQVYPIGVAINGQHYLHSAAASTSFEIACPQPAAVFNITSSQYTPAFKLERSVLLQWNNPCPNQFQCCCPCSFNVMRDGALIGTISNSLSNFTFNFTDTEVVSGQRSTYSIYVVDRLNRTSAEIDTCSHDITVVVGAADKELFTAFFSGTLLGSALVFGAFALVFRRFYRRQRDKYDLKFGTGKHAGKWRDSLVDSNNATLARVNADHLSSFEAAAQAPSPNAPLLPVSLRAWNPSPLLVNSAAPPRPARVVPKPAPAVAAAAAPAVDAEPAVEHDDPLRSSTTLVDLNGL